MATRNESIQSRLLSPPAEQAEHATSAQLLFIGGMLLVAMYALEIVFGVQHGRMYRIEDITTSRLAWMAQLCYHIGMLLIGAGLFGIGAWFSTRSPKLSLAIRTAAFIPAVCSIGNMFLVTGSLGERTNEPLLAGLSVVFNLAAATLAGVAVLRTRRLPRAIGWALLGVGLITFPLILLTIPLESLATPYVAENLPFPVWGAIFAVLGLLLRRHGSQHWRG